LEYVSDGEKVFSAKQKPSDFVEVDHRGNKWLFPWEDVEWDAILIGSYKKLLQEAYYQGDTIGKALRKKLGKTFGIYGYKADKKTIGNDIIQLEKLQKQMSIKNEKILVTPILQQQKIMEELFP
jgi:bifunctional pyridoxal-dependent enzyme with beta-cystathionase and maltose regulon repressor activities